MRFFFLFSSLVVMLLAGACKKDKTVKGSCKLITDTIYNPAHDADKYFKRVSIRQYDTEERLIACSILDSLSITDDILAAPNRIDIKYEGDNVTITDSLQQFVPLSITFNQHKLPVKTVNGTTTRWYRYNEIQEIQSVTDTTNDGIINTWTVTYAKAGVAEMKFASSDLSVPQQTYTFTYFTGILRPHTIIGEMLSDPRALVDLSPPYKWAELFSSYLLQSCSDGTTQVVYNYTFNASKFPAKRFSSTGEVVSYGYKCP